MFDNPREIAKRLEQWDARIQEAEYPITESMIGRVAQMLSFKMTYTEVRSALLASHSGMSEYEIFLAIKAGEVHNTMLARQFDPIGQ